jgi:predicted RND superfamily exporter protein
MKIYNPVKFRKPILYIYLILIGLSLYFASTLKVHYLFENFFPKNDPVYINYVQFRQAFDIDDRVISVALEANSGIFNSDFISQSTEVEKSIAKVQGVEKTTSLSSLRIPVKTPLGWISTPVLSKNPDNLRSDSLRLLSNKSVAGQFISTDGKFFAVQVYLKDSLSDKENRILVERIEAIIEEKGLDFKMAGFINTQVNYIRMLEAEVPFTSLLATLGLSIILFLLYRSPKQALLITAVVFTGLILFFGYLGLIGRPLSVTSTLFTTIMVFVGVSDLIHLQAYFQKYLVKGFSEAESIYKALSETWVNLFMTSATTAVGFLTFMSSSIPHIQTFGLDAAIGVLIAFVVVITLAPVLLFYFPPKGKVLQRLQQEKRWDRFLFSLYKIGKKNHYLILIITAIILLISIFSISNIQINQKLSSNFSDNARIKQDFDFFETYFGGVRAFEATIVPKAGKKILDLEVLQGIEKFEKWLASRESLSSVMSPSFWVKSLNLSISAARDDSFKLPADEESLSFVLLNDRTDNKRTYVNEEQNIGRFAARMKDIGRLKAEELNEEVLNWIKDEDNNIPFDLNITGSAVLIDKNNSNITDEMLYNLGLAFIIISILMALLFRSFGMVIISIIPNLLPLIAVGGFMGLTGIPLNAATSLIFTIGFVIAIDDTIHFLTRFRTESKHSTNIELNLKNTMMYTGRAIVQTSLILFVGYGVMMFSSFSEIAYHAILVATTLGLALLGDVFLLPAILRIAFKKKI